ncbi:hypothetical protein ANCCAN_05822 [Ancylostoma caninum]|uniref:Uncharacterized protein n=1 Tax=Ancylostoma caninum TaxID=29170 RepID=A0A368GYS0_ANCCA|nr:hypothetical protein ANCCAN_05822 [Ancylostoma caninum]
MHEVAQLLRGYCIHSVTERCDSHRDAKRMFIERLKSNGVGENANFVSRTFQKKSWLPAHKSTAASTQVPRSLESKSLSLELRPTTGNEKEATKVQNNHLSPHLPSPNAVSHNKSADTGILVSQPSEMAFQLRNNRKPRRAKSPNRISK